MFFFPFFFFLNEFRYFFVLTTPLFFNHGLGCKRKAEQQIITIPEREEDVIQQNSSKTLMKLNSSD